MDTDPDLVEVRSKGDVIESTELKAELIREIPFHVPYVLLPPARGVEGQGRRD